MKISTPILLHLIFICITLTTKNVSTAPTNPIKNQKSLSYFNFVPQQQPEEDDFQNYIEPTSDEFLSSNFKRFNENANTNNVENKLFSLSRTLGATKKVSNPVFNSPIYYIRLPPQPYMFVPGYGYVSQPELNVPESFLNVPVNFISNGKPGMIYQWNGSYVKFPTKEPPKKIKKPKIKPKPESKPDSIIHRIPGKFVFNGKPNDVFVLSDKFGLYNDGLQSFYP